MPLDPIRLSKFLSLVLRHEPQKIGLILDAQGWASVDDLIGKAAAAGMNFSREELFHVVETSDKKRFTLSHDDRQIRAAQGHSVEVDLGLPAKTPPDILFHGTAKRFLDSILQQGLLPQSRLQVHLSADSETALRVGSRHGSPIVLSVDAHAMHADGLRFYQADNGVWLTDSISPIYLSIL